MTRHLTAISLALIAACAISATAASSAQAVAAEFSWGAGTTKLTGTADGEQIITTTAGETKCNTAAMEASVSGTGGVSITTTSVTYTDAGKVDKCRGPLGVVLTMNQNGCQFRFNAGTTIGEKANGESEGTYDIINCTANGSITTEAIGCIIHIPEQNGIGPIVYKTIAGPPEHITIESKANNIKYVHTGSLCGNGSGANGSYVGGLTVKGNSGNATVT